tara:strand:+ start:1411 stop:5898 length:4488 start_codon:yes stop_codon:yes gene_type:complete
MAEPNLVPLSNFFGTEKEVTKTTEQPVEVQQTTKEPVEKKTPQPDTENKSNLVPLEKFFETSGVSPQAVPDDKEEAPKNTMDSLVKNKDWLKDAQVVYEHERGEKFKGSDAELDYWFRNRHSRLGNDLTNIGLTAADALDMSDEVKLAWINSLDTWDNTEGTLGSFGNAVYQALTDPTTVASIFAGFGVGGIAKLAGQKGATVAAKFAFKDQLKKALTKEVGKEAAEQFIKTGASKKVSAEVLKKARGKAATNLAINRGGTTAASGAGYSAADNLLRQSFNIDISEATDDPIQTETDYIQAAQAALFGAGLGGIFGAGAGKLAQKLGDQKAIKKLARQNELEEAMQPKVPEQTSSLSVSDGDLGARNVAGQAQNQLEEGGKLTIEIGEVVPLEKLREINAQFAQEGMSDLEKIGPGTYRSTKIKTLREVTPETPDKARSKISKIVGRVKRGIYSNPIVSARKTADDFEQELINNNKFLPDNEKIPLSEIKKQAKQMAEDAKQATDKAAIAQRRRDSARVSSERSIATSFQRLEKALNKDLGIKKLGTLSSAQSKLLNDALKGERQASEEVARIAPSVSKELSTMRGNIQKLQTDLLETGAVKKDSQLEGKILASMGKKGDDAELYLTTSYEKFDNPNWSKEVTTREGKDGRTILEGATDYIINQAAVRNPAFGAVLNKFRRGEALNPQEEKIYNDFMGADGEINTTINRILDTNEDDVLKVFSESTALGRGPTKILARKQDIPEEIKMLMGEYQDPLVNYAKTISKINQTLAQINYEKEIVDLADQGFLSGVRTTDSGTGDFVRVAGRLPQRADVVDPLAKDIETGMDGLYAYPELADAIIRGNDFGVTQIKPLQTYLMLQGHTRAAKTVYSITAIARNFIGAGWMSMGAGYMSPKNIGQIRQVAKGLSSMGDEDLNEVIEKGISLGYLQSGTDIGAFRAALGDASDDSFWNFTNKALQDKNSLVERAKKLNVKAVKFYQSMDDMWKQFAFISEKDNYRQVLRDKGTNPDEVVRSIITGDGRKVDITQLDEYAANEVAKHMQNYAGVPQFVRRARLLPMADFLAFTTEIIRTQKNIIKTALKDMKEGRELMKTGQEAVDADGKKTGLLVGQAQKRAGERRLGSIIAAQSAAPALAAGSVALTGMDEKVVDRNGKEMPYTKKEAFEAFDQPWQKGSNFIYLGEPEKGKIRRINISYINPWAKTQDPIRAGLRALASGGDIDQNLDKAFAESVWRPVKETFGLSMLAEATFNMINNQNEFGKEVFKETDTLGEKFRTGVVETLSVFEPGIVKSGRDIATSLNAPKRVQRETFLGNYDIPVGFTRSGAQKGLDEQIMSLSGIKPETTDIKDTLGFKVNDIKSNMGESGETFRKMYQQRTPITTEELVEAYSTGLAKEYEYAKEMFDLISRAKSADLNNKDIILAITDGGLFKNRLDKKMLVNLVNKGRFIPAPPNIRDIEKWAISTEKRTGRKPPVQEARNQIMRTYRRYVGEITGER